MTEKLKTLMHERADAVDFAVPDIDTMVRAGDRRRRTRRLSVVGGVVGVAAAAVGLALVAPGLVPGEDRVVAPAAPTAPTSAPPVSWALGSVLHEGDTETTLPFEVRAYVRTAEGYVLADREGRVWSQTDQLTEVGRTDADNLHLAADEESGLAGWVDLTGDRPRFAVLDQATGQVTTYDGASGSSGDQLAALDDGSAYVRTEGGAAVLRLGEDGQATPRPVAGVDTSFRMGDLEDGLVSVHTDEGTRVQDLDGEVVRTLSGAFSDLGYFSPDARYYTWDADEPQVYEVATGERVTLDVGRRGFATGFEWLGPQTLAVLASAEAEDSSTAELLVCQVPEGSCEKVAELGSFDSLEGSLALPVGIPVG